MGRYEVTCRACGAQGTEEDDGLDPAPGLCPQCLDDRMARVMERAFEAVRGGIDFETVMASTERALIDRVGLTPAWAHQFVMGNRAAFTEAINTIRVREAR